ncbi:ABC transporter permease subunit [Moraxella marmotae]|uniref:ABC transporter permease subunit n=1 Tax=Moraxella marmotae TaxID=3344520 RepID=UPI0035F3124A
MTKKHTGQIGMAKFWQKFRQQRLAYYSLILFGVMTLVAVFAPIIANDKPLLVRYQGEYLLPILHDYPETKFGGEFETTANYQDQAVVAMIRRDGELWLPPIAYGEFSLVLDAQMPHPASPSRSHWLGTDDVGHDVLARILYALRVSLLFGLALSVFGAVMGVGVGALMGYFGGMVDLFGQRLVEIWASLPQLFVMMIIASIFEPSLSVLFVLLLCFGWLSLTALTRVQVLKMRQMPYVLASKNLGIAPTTIIIRHILPKVVLLSVSQLPFMIAANIAALTTLDFLGFGLPLGAASLGELLAQGKNHLDAPHLVLSGFVVLSLLLSLLIFIGEGLRSAFDTQG